MRTFKGKSTEAVKTDSPKKTVGEEALKLASKIDKQPDSIELQREIHKGSNSEKSYEEEIFETLQRGIDDPKIEGDFYIIVLTKRERHLQNVIRNLFFYRQSCPTPEFDQTVYQVKRKTKEINYLWTVPNNSTCQYLPSIKTEIPEDQLILVDMIEKFKSGKLDELAKKLNKELII